MASIRTSTLPLLNPDTRPLPPGWTQHYNAEKKLWIYLDMNVLPPRASLTHPSGPPPPPPSRPAAAHGRGSSAGFPAWSSLNTPHRNALQRDRLTVAQRLYSSALPPVEKAGFDEFGIPVNFNADELAPPAPSYGSIDPTTFTSSASPVSTTSTTTSTSSSPNPPNIGRTPGRRPLPRPPVPNLTATTTSQRPAPSRPPDDPALTQAVDHHSESPTPLQPTPIKASDNVFSRRQVGSATLSDTLLQAIPQAEPQPRVLPRYARKPEPPRSKSSNNVPHRPVLPPSSSSHTLPKKLSFVGQPVIAPSASNTTLNSSSAHSPETPFQSPVIPSARVSMSNLAPSNDPTYFGVSQTQSTTSLSSGPAPLPPPLTRGTSAPPTPEPTRVRFPPNLKPPVRNTFAPPEIVAMLNRQIASSSSAVGSDRDNSRDSFDPMSLYSDTSHPASLHASSPSPQSHEQRSLQVHQTLSQSTSSRTSMSSCVSPIPSAISASGSTGILSHQSMQLATNNDPDLVETPRSSPGKSTKKDGGNKLKKMGFRFGRMSFLPKKQSGADRLDLTADPLDSSSAKISAELGKVIKDGFREVMGHNNHRRGEVQLPEPAGVASLQVQMQAMNMGSRVSLPLQPQDTSGTLRPTTPQPNTLSPLPFPLNQSFSRATLRPNRAPSPEASGSGSQNQNIPQISNSGERPGTPSRYRQSMSSSPSFPSRLSPMLPSPRRESFHAPSAFLQAPLAHPLPQPLPQRQYNARKDPFDMPLQIPNTPAPEYQSSANTHIGSFYPFNSSPSAQFQPTGYGDLGESPLE